MSRLFICEKPDQARHLASVIGQPVNKQGYLEVGSDSVTWCIGHLLEESMPEDYDTKWKRWSVADLPIRPESWRMKVSRNKSKQHTVIKNLLKKFDHVVIATDAGREGEVIGREVLDYNNWSGKLDRLWAQALDKKSLTKALNNLRDGSETYGLYHSGLGRSRADWLVGINLTRALTLFVKQNGYDQVLSIGRVQTPALNLIYTRDMEIESFVSSDFYSAKLSFAESGLTVDWLPSDSEKESQCDESGHCFNRDYINQIVNDTQGQTGVVQSVNSKIVKSRAPLPLNLSTLQKICSKKFKLSAAKTLEVAQALYEQHKVSSYPRTSSRYLPENQFAEAPELIETALVAMQIDHKRSELLSAGLSDTVRSSAWNDSKLTDHHAIIPLPDAQTSISKLSDIEKKVFYEICWHYLVQFFPPSESKETIVVVECSGYQFKANGKVPLNLTWRILESEKKQDQLPDVSEGQELQNAVASLITKKTSPPKRFTEGTLIDAMANIQKYIDDDESKSILKENEGIGTEATRADVIEVLKKRKFLKVDKNNLISTDLGRALIKQAPNELSDPVTTAMMERQLSLVETGELSLEAFLETMGQYVNMMLVRITNGELSNAFSSVAKAKPKAKAEITDIECEQCGKPMVKRKGKKGYFLGCSGFPECRNIQSI